MPRYTPSGFKVENPIQYQKGLVSVKYTSASDDRSYHITQQQSDWNSESLLKEFVEQQGKVSQTLQLKGKTIYIYDGNNATWVDGGIWYQVESEDALNNDQLLKIVNSL
jgi:hypothetical protein